MDELAPGARVKIRGGPFDGFDGEVVGPGEAPGSLEVSVEIFGKATPMPFDREAVQPVAADPRPAYRKEIERVVRIDAYLAGQCWWQERLQEPEEDLAAEWREFEKVKDAAEGGVEGELKRRLESLAAELSDAALAENRVAWIEERWRAERQSSWCRREHESDYRLEEAVASRQARARRAAWLERCPDRLEGLFAVIAERAPGFVERLAPGASEEEIAAFQERLGLDLPASFLGLFRHHNGGLRFFRGLELMSLRVIAEVKEMMDGHVAKGAFDRWREGEWWSSAWVPFLQDRDSIYDMLCVDTVGSFDGVPGQLVSWCRDAPEREIVAPSFDAWIEVLWVGLFEGVYYAEEDGITENVKRSHSLTEALFPGYPRRVEVGER